MWSLKLFTGGIFKKWEDFFFFVNQTGVVLDFMEMYAFSSLLAISTEVPLSKALKQPNRSVERIS